MNASMTITARDIVAGYGDGPDIVRGTSLTAEAGRVTTLLGPNGCGKSTLLRTMSRLLAPRSGSVEVGGEDVHALTARDSARRVAVLPQHPMAPEGLTVGELVARGRHPHRPRWRGSSAHDREVVAQALERTGTAELADRDLAALSGGQRQRAWLAMAVAQDTPVLLLDEPTTYLDPAHAIEMLDLVRGLADDGRTVVMVLHDLALAAAYSDTVVVMKDGAILADGGPRESITPELLAAAYGLRADVLDDPCGGTAPLIVARGTV
ncbi:ABC transporter ATP-binding protein [Corynebacterium sp. NPDC060344]|uniref:ABC transporter ATP-binding protein n=1 Tax=Corynebacterium sp. NPDC060344 TaxID=3347101 RepID=UPI003646D236